MCLLQNYSSLYCDSTATVEQFTNEAKYHKHAHNCRNDAPGGHIGEDGVREVALRPVLGNPCVLLHTARQHHAVQQRGHGGGTASVATLVRSSATTTNDSIEQYDREVLTARISRAETSRLTRPRS